VWVAVLAITLSATLLGGCGGGSSDGGAAPGAGSAGLSVSLAGSAHPGVDHVWVTVSAVALHTEADRAWSTTDPSWQVFTLAQPVTIDLATQTNGTVTSLLRGRGVAPGTYPQLRLFVLAHDEPLATSAAQRHLLYNAQVDSTDALGVAHSVPLELPAPTLGLRAAGPVVTTSGALTSINLAWDLERSLARFSADDGVDRFTLRPDLRVLDLASTGAIVGLIDKSLLCAAGATGRCIDELVVSAQLPSDDGRMSVSVRSTPVILGETYAVFALYPLPVSPTGTFDVVVRGRNMQTMLVRQVPASAADLLAASPTQLGANPADPANPAPLVPVLSSPGDAQLSLAQPLSPDSAQLLVAQTPPGAGELPHEVAVAQTDPFTGLLTRPVTLPGGPLRVATYSDTAALVFTEVVPQEGSETFTVAARGTRYDDDSALTVASVPGGSSTSVTTADPARRGGLDNGTLTVDLTRGATPFDAAELVVADVGGVVATQDVSSLLAQPAAQLSVPLPAGANAAALGGTAVYTVSVRAWRRAAPAQSLQWVRVRPAVDLRTASTAGVSIVLP
jgi:hypothetical protein